MALNSPFALVTLGLLAVWNRALSVLGASQPLGTMKKARPTRELLRHPLRPVKFYARPRRDTERACPACPWTTVTRRQEIPCLLRDPPLIPWPRVTVFYPPRQVASLAIPPSISTTVITSTPNRRYLHLLMPRRLPFPRGRCCCLAANRRRISRVHHSIRDRRTLLRQGSLPRPATRVEASTRL